MPNKRFIIGNLGRWQCPKCGTKNSVHHRHCTKCNYFRKVK